MKTKLSIFLLAINFILFSKQQLFAQIPLNTPFVVPSQTTHTSAEVYIVFIENCIGDLIVDQFNKIPIESKHFASEPKQKMIDRIINEKLPVRFGGNAFFLIKKKTKFALMEINRVENSNQIICNEIDLKSTVRKPNFDEAAFINVILPK
ncbi:MAG TPA: hypothetical protein PKM51_06895 [Chitinophagales bacterium]|nr:hypothetical protein [Chitinophagales bacterium]